MTTPLTWAAGSYNKIAILLFDIVLKSFSGRQLKRAADVHRLETWNSAVWEDSFATEGAAFAEALKMTEAEGFASLAGSALDEPKS